MRSSKAVRHRWQIAQMLHDSGGTGVACAAFLRRQCAILRLFAYTDWNSFSRLLMIIAQPIFGNVSPWH